MPASVYPAAPQTARRDLAIGLVVSLIIFVGAPVLSTWLKSGPPKPPAKDVIPHIEMVMPKIEPDEEVVDDTTPQTQPADIAPPMQTDVPQIVTDTSFVQKLEPPPPEGMAVDRGAITVPAGALGFGKGGQIFDPSMLDQQPVPTYQPHPLYPYDMKKQGISGQVVVEFILNAEGNVQSAFSVSSTQHEFEASAIQAVSKWRFKPGRRGGRAVNTRMQVPIVFSLNNED
jgi:periplasmic protein TonB